MATCAPVVRSIASCTDPVEPLRESSATLSARGLWRDSRSDRLCRGPIQRGTQWIAEGLSCAVSDARTRAVPLLRRGRCRWNAKLRGRGRAGGGGVLGFQEAPGQLSELHIAILRLGENDMIG